MADKFSKTMPLNEFPFKPQDPENQQEGEWLIQIKEGINAQNTIRRPPTVCIFSVPKMLVDLKRDAYLPQVVSVGPCFHRHRELSDMDNHKLRAAQRLIHRGIDINFLVGEIEKMEGKIRDSYEKIIDCNSETLAWIMLLDGSFLLELFKTLGARGSKDLSNSDCMYFEPIFDENRIKSVGFAVLRDILKLENQIPLFVMVKMLELEAGSEKEPRSRLFHLLLNAASTFFPFEPLQLDRLSRFELDSMFIGRGHFLGFLHGLILSYLLGEPLKNSPKSSSSSSSSSSAIDERNLCKYVLPSAWRLYKAGIRIRSCAGDGRRAIRFDKETSTLYLPVVKICENTETVLRNLVALEAFLPSELQVISCYVGLMNSLTYTECDTTMLRMEGLLYIYVGNDGEVTQLWRSLCKGMAISSIQSLRSLKKEIIEHYESKWRARFVEFVMNHFTRPRRTTISFLAGVLIFLFTLTQTLSSMYGFYRASP